MKDPACLFYWNDWYGGTSGLSRHLKGCYMDVLHSQFNLGPLNLDQIITVLGTDYELSWPRIRDKFIQDETGKFYNSRLEIEKERRRKFTNSRLENLKSNSHTGEDSKKNNLKKNLPTPTVIESKSQENSFEKKSHTDSRMEIEIRNINSNYLLDNKKKEQMNKQNGNENLLNQKSKTPINDSYKKN